jgi:hypothetical protein
MLEMEGPSQEFWSGTTSRLPHFSKTFHISSRQHKFFSKCIILRSHNWYLEVLVNIEFLSIPIFYGTLTRHNILVVNSAWITVMYHITKKFQPMFYKSNWIGRFNSWLEFRFNLSSLKQFNHDPYVSPIRCTLRFLKHWFQDYFSCKKNHSN